jgi:hypothetical protein
LLLSSLVCSLLPSLTVCALLALPAGDRYLLGIDTNIGYVAACEDSGMLLYDQHGGYSHPTSHSCSPVPFTPSCAATTDYMAILVFSSTPISTSSPDTRAGHLHSGDSPQFFRQHDRNGAASRAGGAGGLNVAARQLALSTWRRS